METFEDAEHEPTNATKDHMNAAKLVKMIRENTFKATHGYFGEEEEEEK